MARTKSVKKRKYTRRAKVRKPRKPSKLEALQAILDSGQRSHEYQQRLANDNFKLAEARKQDSDRMSVRISELKSEIIWFKQLVQNLEKKIGQGVTVTTAAA